MHRRLVMMVFGLVLLALAVQPASAQFDKAKDVKKHLEKKHDYRVSKEDNYLSAKHDKWLNMTLREYKGGILMRAYLETSQYDRDDLEALCNKLNYSATAARMYIDNEDDLIFECWFPGKYDKDRFEALLEAWHNDTIGQAATIQAELDM